MRCSARRTTWPKSPSKRPATSTGRNLGIVGDYLLWYAKDIDQLKYRQLYLALAR